MYDAEEDALVARLTDKLAGLVLPSTLPVKVFTAAELERVPDLRQFAPAVHILYQGYTAGQEVGQGIIQSVVLQWSFVCAARSAALQGEATPAVREAGKIASVVISALCGFSPLANGAQLRLSDSPEPMYQGGYCYLPVNFRLKKTFKGSP